MTNNEFSTGQINSTYTTEWTYTDSATTDNTFQINGGTGLWINGDDISFNGTITAANYPFVDPNFLGNITMKDGFIMMVHDDGSETKLVDIKSGEEINSLLNVVAKKLLKK